MSHHSDKSCRVKDGQKSGGKCNVTHGVFTEAEKHHLVGSFSKLLIAEVDALLELFKIQTIQLGLNLS